MTLARWPNEGRFHYAGDRPSRWLEESEIWLHGFWFWDWADQNNIFVDCDPSVHVDARGLGPYRNDLWSSRYPTLVNILDDEPMVPKGNLITRNVSWGGSWDEIEEKARAHVRIENNFVNIDPSFTDTC